LQTQLSWLQLNNTLEELAEELQVNASDYVISFTRSLVPAQAARAWLAAAPFLLDPVQIAAHLGKVCGSKHNMIHLTSIPGMCVRDLDVKSDL